MRILCLDIGTKRIGIAATDPMGWTAQGIAVIERSGGDKDLGEIARFVSELEAEMIVVGLPLNEEGEMGPEAERVRKFADRLEAYLEKNGTELPVKMWDERYSTAIAEERLIELDVSRKRRKEVIDKMAAVVILEDYLGSNDISPERDENVEG